MLDLVACLSRLLADVVTFRYIAHGAHWNVTGHNFPQYHELLGTIYEDAEGSVDPIAENIRKVGAVAPGSLSQFVALRSLSDPPPSTDAPTLLAQVADANDAILVSLSATFAAAMDANEQGIANFLSERLDQHEKWRWQLRATIGEPVVKAPAQAPAKPQTVGQAVVQQVVQSINN